jgi:hypothetical protein
MTTKTNIGHEQQTNPQKKARKPRKWSDIATKRGYTLPVRLQCRITGKQVAYTSPVYIDKKIEEYGSMDKLHRNFISREGRAQLAQQTSPQHSQRSVAEQTGSTGRRQRGRPRKNAVAA